jgi:hypothetical protein
MTDYKALCARMADELDHYRQLLMDDRRETHALATEARAALAQPEPEGPSDEELTQFLFENFRGPIEFLCDAEEEAHLMIRSHVKFARAVLARWGRPAPQPVPVSERLPGPEDCDAEGRCWIYMPDIGTAPSWRLVDPRDIGPYHTHWLPAHALPVPANDC